MAARSSVVPGWTRSQLGEPCHAERVAVRYWAPKGSWKEGVVPTRSDGHQVDRELLDPLRRPVRAEAGDPQPRPEHRVVCQPDAGRRIGVGCHVLPAGLSRPFRQLGRLRVILRAPLDEVAVVDPAEDRARREVTGAGTDSDIRPPGTVTRSHSPSVATLSLENSRAWAASRTSTDPSSSGMVVKSASISSASGTSCAAISSMPAAPSRPITRRPSPSASRAAVPVPVPTSICVSPGRSSARRTTSCATGTNARAMVAA